MRQSNTFKINSKKSQFTGLLSDILATKSIFICFVTVKNLPKDNEKNRYHNT